MNHLSTIFLAILITNTIVSCTKKSYSTSGEIIYRTGKNVQGDKLLDPRHSSITFVKSCQTCHGRYGDRNTHCDVKWSFLTDPKKLNVPYNDSLFFRFLDKDLKSDGSPARTGVHWNMSLEEKSDLLKFIKTL